MSDLPATRLASALLRHKSELRPVVKVQSGLLEGTHFGSNPNGAAFIGIRFAAPPIGDLRWKPPQPAPKWSGTHKTDNFGAPCPQLPARRFRYIEGNEHCLYLNIRTTSLRNTDIDDVE
jgi:para-nitrobenzyl esterase